MEKAEQLKTQANEFFAKGKYKQALELYDQAIELNPNSAIYYNNRAFTYFKLEQYGGAIADATKSIELDKTYAKAYYRRASAYLALGKYKDGLRDFKQVVKIYPANKEAQEKLKQCEKIVKRIRFEEAIAVEETSIADSIDLSEITVENDYEGPHLPTPITKEFVMQLVDHLKKQKKLHVKYVYQILIDMKKMLSSLDSLVTVEIPDGQCFNVCGDTHGQFYDLCNIFETNGWPSETNPYLFNGDFVDRGSFSVKAVLTLFAHKLLYPNHFHMLRGNHEGLNMNRTYGFEGEVVSKYSKRVFDLFTEVFNWIPLSAHIKAPKVNKSALVVHGGLFSQEGVTLEDIRKIHRNQQPPDSGLMCEMLWSDPQPFPGLAPNKRGVGVAFGPDVTHKFLKHNNLDLVIRSHEVKEEGYLVEADGKLITVFSAPNYCDQTGNKGALIKFDDQFNTKFVQFTAVPHPDVKPMAYANNFGMF